MSYFAVTAVRMDQGNVTHVLLRPLDEEPKEKNTLIAIREGKVVPVDVVANHIQRGDTVYLGRRNPEKGYIDLATETPLQVQGGASARLVSEPPEALGQLPTT